MANKEILDWFRAESRIVDLDAHFANLSLTVRRKRGPGKIPFEYLTPQEGMMMARVDARTTIQGLFEVTGFDHATVLRTLYTLIESGILELADDETMRRERKEGETLRTVLESVEARLTASPGDPYAVLGVSAGGSRELFTAAYRSILLHFHPKVAVQHRRFEKRVAAMMEALIWAYDAVLGDKSGGDVAAAPAPLATPSQTATLILPYPDPANDGERAQNFCFEASVQMREKNYPKALVFLDQAARLDPQNVNVHLLRGTAMLSIRDLWDKAEAQFQAVLAAQPQNAEAWLGLARLYIKRKMKSRAAEALQKAREASPVHPSLPRIEQNIMRL